MEEMPGLRVRTLYPDMGVAAMLANEWPDRGFEVSSLTGELSRVQPCRAMDASDLCRMFMRVSGRIGGSLVEQGPLARLRNS